MANIEKRGESYRITVSCGYDVYGRKKRAHMTVGASGGSL